MNCRHPESINGSAAKPATGRHCTAVVVCSLACVGASCDGRFVFLLATRSRLLVVVARCYVKVKSGRFATGASCIMVFAA